MWFFDLIILLGVPTLIKSAVYFDKHGSNKPKRLHTTIQLWISSPASFSPWKTQIAKKQQASMPHLIFALMIAMLCHLVACFRWRNFQLKQNCQFVPRCSNRNNPGELHSSVETCITRRLHWGSPSWRRLHWGSLSWRRLHLGINSEDTFTGEVHSKTSFLDTVPNSLTGEVNSNSSSLAKLSTGLVMFLQRFCFIASCYPGLS